MRGKQVGGVHRCAVEVARWEDLVAIYASVCFEVDQTRADFYIARGASILPGPGCSLIIREPSPLVEGKTEDFGFGPQAVPMVAWAEQERTAL